MAQWKFMCTTAFVALVAGNAALADVTPEEVWANWKDMATAAGETLTVTSEGRDGDTLVVSGFKLVSGDTEADATITIDQIDLTENGDGSVDVTLSDSYPLVIRAAGEVGKPDVTTKVSISHPDLTITVSGCDVADWPSVQAAFAAVQARWGRLDVLVNNAGVIDPIARLAEADPAAWRRAIDINLTGVFHGMRAAVPLMQDRGAGTILTVSSGAAHRPLEGWSAYCASKAGVAMLTRALHEEEGHWLHAIGLSPGTVATEMQVKIKASGLNAVSQLDPSAHIPADWPARALLWLAGPAGAKWAGQEVSLRDEGIRKEVGLIA